MTAPSSRNEHALLEQLIAASPFVMLRLNLTDSVATYVSPNVERILGFTPDEILGKPGWSRHHLVSDDLTTIDEETARATAAQAPEWETEARFLRRDGKPQWVTMVVRPEYDAAGNPTGAMAYVWDIAERRAAQEASRQAREFLDSVIENLPHMIFVKDARDLRFVRINRAGEDLLGQPRDALIGKNDYDFFPPDQADFFTGTDRAVLEGGQVVDIPEEPIDTAAAGRRILHTKKIPILDAAGKAEFLLGISEDITERKAAEAALLAAQVEAQQANLAKSEFLSRMSHELRTPLNAVLGFTQVLEMDDLTPEQRDSLHHISRGGRHLLDLINEVLDISRIEARQMTLSPEPVALADLLTEVVGLIAPLAGGRSITLDTTTTGCDAYVLADRQRLTQVFLNLLSNAVKYNRDGGSVTIACANDKGERLRIRVTDTGYGIPPDRLDRLFLPFERLGAAQSGVEGTGLGLALSRGLIEAMGGAIGVESELDRGTTFWIELDIVESPLEAYERRQPAIAPTVTANTPRTRKVLLIEDNVANRKLVERLVARRPHIELVSAMQGRSGLELARKHRPDLVLLDLHLPDMPGRDILRRLRSYPETRDIPVVIISADATSRQIAGLTDEGAAGYLTKPLDVAAFFELVDGILGDRPGDAR